MPEQDWNPGLWSRVLLLNTPPIQFTNNQRWNPAPPRCWGEARQSQNVIECKKRGLHWGGAD